MARRSGGRRRPLLAAASPLAARWPLLSTYACVLVTAAVTVLGPAVACPGFAGPVCGAGGPPGAVQVLLVGALFVAGWVAAYGATAVQERVAGRRPRPPGGLGVVADPAAMLPALIAFGLAGAVADALQLASGRPRPALLAVALLPGLVAVWARSAGARPDGRQRAAAGRPAADPAAADAARPRRRALAGAGARLATRDSGLHPDRNLVLWARAERVRRPDPPPPGRTAP